MLESIVGLVDAGWDVAVALPGPGPLTAEIKRRGARVLTCASPVLRKSALRPSGMLRLLGETVRGLWCGGRLVRRWRPDVLYVSTLTVPLWLVLAKLAGVRTVCHVHEAEGSASKLLRAALALPLFLADRVITNSQYSRGVLLSGCPRLDSRVRVVYNGVTGPPVVVRPRQHLEGPVRLLYIGRLSERKGADLAIEALALLVKDGQDVELDVLGAVFPGYEHYERRLHQQVAEHRLEDRVRFLGFESTVWDRLASADIAVVPSRLDEPFGNTAVEAVLAARPLVVSDTSGLREATEGFGSVARVEPGSARAIADAALQLRDDWAARRRWAVTDSEAAARRFAPGAYRADLMATMRDLVPPALQVRRGSYDKVQDRQSVKDHALTGSR